MGVLSCWLFPLAQPATGVILSNVPAFIRDEFLKRELSRHGKVASLVRKDLSGCKSPLLSHVVSHRYQVFMILPNRSEEHNLHVKVDNYDYILFATSSAMKFFDCGEEFHTIKACPNKTVLAAVAAGENSSVPVAINEVVAGTA